MTEEEREKQRLSQWRVLEKVRPRFESWLKEQSWAERFHQLEFIPHAKFLEIFVFYKTDADIIDGNTDGISKAIKKKMLSDLADLKYPQLVEAEVQFIFDSHENVVKNYEGSYFYRLR